MLYYNILYYTILFYIYVYIYISILYTINIVGSIYIYIYIYIYIIYICTPPQYLTRGRIEKILEYLETRSNKSISSNSLCDLTIP